MLDPAAEFLANAEESLACAASEHAAGRYNNCANRCYYGAFQAAIAALIRAGVTTRGTRGEWGHDFVQAEFAQLVRRRKLYSAEFADTLARTMTIRLTADYRTQHISRTQAEHALRRSRVLISAVRVQSGSEP